MVKFKWGKVLFIVLSLCVVLFGCSSNSGTEVPPINQGGETNTPAKTDVGAPATEDVFPLAEKMTIDLYNSAHPTKPTIGDEPIFAKMEERTNVHLNLINVNRESYDDQFLLTLAAGNRPEIMEVNLASDAKKYGMEGAFMPLNDLLAEHGPNILQMIEEHGIDLEVRAADGNIYGIPTLIWNNQPASILIRQDWLDQLQLEVPETPEQFHQVLKAFKDNKVGGENTVPMSGRGVNLFNYIFLAFDTYDRMYLKDGKFEYGPALPAMKDGLEYVRQLYVDGLVDPEFATLSPQQFEAKLNSGQVGTVMLGPNRSQLTTEILKVDNPEAKLVGIAPLKNKSGNIAVEMYSPLKSMLALSPDISQEKAKLIVQYYNFINSEEGRLLTQYGIENEHYAMKDGQPVYTDEFKADLANNLLAFFGPFTGRALNSNPLPNLFNDRNEGTLTAEAVKASQPYYTPATPVPNFTAEEVDVISTIQSQVEDKAQEYMTKFILGQEPLTKFDEYITELEKRGVHELVEIYNTAYQRDLNSAK